MSYRFIYKYVCILYIFIDFLLLQFNIVGESEKLDAL